MVMTMASRYLILYFIYLLSFYYALSGQMVIHRFTIKQNITITNHHRDKAIHVQSWAECGMICGQDLQCGGATMNTTNSICNLHNYTGSILYPLVLEQSIDICSLLREDEEFREIPAEYVYNEDLKFWFKVVTTPRSNATDAKTVCYNDGAYLILIDSQEVFTFVKDTMAKFGLSRIYFQGYRETDSDPWVDDENNPLTFVAWQPTGAGSGSYIRMTKDSLMEASSGIPIRSYICQLYA